MRVELSAEAEAQVEKIDAWWRANRLAAPDLFITELDRAIISLEGMPSLGTTYQLGSKTVRRLILRRTHYHLYFVPMVDRLVVVSVWSAFRGRDPEL